MSFKTGGKKIVCNRNDGGYYTTPYTIYCAVESVSDIEVYRMFDEYGNEVPIEISAVDDASHGKYNIIDCLHALRNLGVGTHSFGKFKSGDVVVEGMSREEMDKIFG